MDHDGVLTRVPIGNLFGEFGKDKLVNDIFVDENGKERWLPYFEECDERITIAAAPCITGE